MTLRHVVVAAIPVAAISISACDPKFNDYMRERRPRADAMRAQVQSLAEKAAAAPRADPGGRCPPLHLTIDREHRAGNAEVYLPGDLARAANAEGINSFSGIDHALSTLDESDHALSLLMVWMYQPSDTLTSGRISSFTRDTVTRALGLTHVIIVRPRPAIPGQQDVDVYIGELATGNIVCGFSVYAMAGSSGGNIEEATRTAVTQAIAQRVGIAAP